MGARESEFIIDRAGIAQRPLKFECENGMHNWAGLIKDYEDRQVGEWEISVENWSSIVDLSDSGNIDDWLINDGLTSD